MKALSVVGVALVAGLVAAPTMAASSMQPPMNEFNEAFYTCDNGGAFLISYDSDKPESATMTTSNNNKKYILKRMPVATGVQFSGDAAKFWTDGKIVTVDGTESSFMNCKVKSG